MIQNEQLYFDLRSYLISEGLKVNPYREIKDPTGIQFIVFDGGDSVVLRCFDQEELSIEASSDSSAELKLKVTNLIKRFIKLRREKAEKQPAASEPIFPLAPAEDPDTLIGVAHYGDKCHFGPLVVVAVCISPDINIKELDTLTETAAKIDWIRDHCPHAMMSIPTKDYNSVLDKFPNPRHLISWAQFRVIEAVMKQTPCMTVLASEFGNTTLIQTTFLSRGKKPTLYTRPGKKPHPALALADLVAHFQYHKDLTRLSTELGVILPEGPQSEENIYAVLNQVSATPIELVKESLS